MTCCQAVISNSASCDEIALMPDGLDGEEDTRRGRKKENKWIKAKKKKRNHVKCIIETN